MKDKARLIDIGKSCAIVLLFVSAIFLLYKSTMSGQQSFLGEFKSLFGGSSSPKTVEQKVNEDTVLSSNPVFILVTVQDGSHYAVKYNNETKKKLITQFSSNLCEALGSSGEPREITTSEWQAALSGSGVFFDYLYPQPLSIIVSSLGYDIKSGASQKTARRFYLGSETGNLKLYFISEDDGRIYSCDTVLSFSSLESKIAECPTGNAKFAFESGDEYAKLDPYFIFSNESVALRGVTVSNPVRGSGFDGAGLLKYFGMSQVVLPYIETDGSLIYVDGAKSLRIGSSGKVLFQVTENGGQSITGEESGLTIADCILACNKIVMNSVGLSSGDGVTGLVNIEDTYSPSSCTVSFGYFVSGIPVTLPGDSYAASFKFRGGSIVKAELYFRSYAISDSTVNALREKQAAVIAEATGGEPVLTYDDKTDSVSCTWIRN